MSTIAKILGLALLLWGTAAVADPWKDESGHGRDRRGGYDGGRHYDHDRDPRSAYGIPRGHLPPPGLCRVWFDHRPAGQQPPPTDCQRARRIAHRYGGEVIWGRRR